MVFEQRSIANSQTLGEQLRRIRISRDEDIKAVAQFLRIKPDYLEAIEKSNYTALPSRVFVQHYVRKYATYLGLQLPFVNKLLQEELAVYDTTPDIPTIKKHLMQQPLRIIQVVIALGVVFILIGVISYFGFEIKNISQPPELTLEDIPAQVSFDQRSITLAGKTVPEASVLINDQAVPVKSDGSFSQPMTLQPGVNVFKIVVKAKRSKEHIKYQQIIVQEAKQP